MEAKHANISDDLTFELYLAMFADEQNGLLHGLADSAPTKSNSHNSRIRCIDGLLEAEGLTLVQHQPHQ